MTGVVKFGLAIFRWQIKSKHEDNFWGDINLNLRYCMR